VKNRNSRWDTAPLLDRNGRPKTAVVTARDIETFSPLIRHRYLPVDYLHAFVGGSLDALVNRLNLLSRRPNLYVARPHQQRANASANYRRLIYELTEKGSRVMQERGFEFQRGRAPANFAHEVMLCQIMASFEFGAREAGLRFVTWKHILTSKHTPETTRQEAKPWHIPVRINVDGKLEQIHVVADGQFFGIRRIFENENSYVFCPGIEADCGSEPVEASNFARSSIYKKFVAYREIIKQDIAYTRYGLPNLLVPFITTTRIRMQSMMKLLERMTDGKGSEEFLFKTFPSLTSFEKPPSPSGRMLTEDWERVGFEPFSFLTSWSDR
jgi:hypothetical protein